MISTRMFIVLSVLGWSNATSTTGSLPVRSECGSCKNSTSRYGIDYAHYFSISQFREELAATELAPVGASARVRRPERVSGGAIGPRVQAGAGIGDTELLDEEWEDESGSEIVYCSSDLGCHGYRYAFYCLAMHDDCLISAAADFIAASSDGTPNVADLSKALAEAPQNIKVNWRRASIQIINCKGAVIGNIPMARTSIAVAFAQAAIARAN